MYVLCPETRNCTQKVALEFAKYKPTNVGKLVAETQSGPEGSSEVPRLVLPLSESSFQVLRF